jgi:TPR repeat protein
MKIAFLFFVLTLVLSMGCGESAKKTTADKKITPPEKIVKIEIEKKPVKKTKSAEYYLNEGKKLSDTNITKALEYFLIACELNSGEGCFIIGTVYWLNKALSLSYEYFKKSCELKNKRGCHNMKLVKGTMIWKKK